MTEENIERTEDVLMAAIDTGEILTIIYQGGRHPGAARQIQPFQIEDNKIRALDIESGMRKQFIISKIEITDESALQQEYVPDIYHRESVSVEDLIEYHSEKMKKLGWVVVAADNKIELFLRFKNGKPRKTPSVGIYYQENVLDYFDDSEGEEAVAVYRKSKRPWYAGGKSFKNPQHAFQAFIDEAVKHAPPPADGDA